MAQLRSVSPFPLPLALPLPPPPSKQVQKTLTIVVLDGNDAPTGLRITTNGALLTILDENTPIGTVLGTLSAVDQDCCDTYRYTMVDASRTFTLQTLANGSVVLATTQNIDFETRSLYNFSVVAEDDRGLAYRGYYPINVRDVNEAPSAVTLIMPNSTSSLYSVPEAMDPNYFVGTLRTVDPDTWQNFT